MWNRISILKVFRGFMWVLFGSLGLISCIDSAPSPTDKKAVFDELWQSVELYAANLDNRGVNWDSIYTIYSSQVNNSITDEEFFEVCKQTLFSIQDPHITLISPSKEFYTLDNLGYESNIDLQTTQTLYLSNLITDSNQIFSADIKNRENIAYLYISNFKGDKNSNLPTIFGKYIESISEKDGLIIDLRGNDGGNAIIAGKLLGMLTSESQIWHITQNKISETELDEPYTWYIEPNEKTNFLKPVVVLTSRFSISAAERFVMGARNLNQVWVVGDTTAGSQGSVMGREMLNGWKYTLTFEKCFDKDGINYDGMGIPPDIYVTQNDFVGDEILERALELF
ncbi:S41 family peptidase [Bernardetia sp. OM2101]|uniref:S41 family peptidase n=1 Tax=Bernardetia sp. OM2101 TaxID=3344876 RepID=UPI0035CF88CF